jgi:DNA-directed RNA polymerase subunit RPC12/RpoP
MLTKARCPKCHSKDLLLQEKTVVVTEWEQLGGNIDTEEGYHNPSHSIGVDGKCSKCGHRWTFRNCIHVAKLYINV